MPLRRGRPLTWAPHSLSDAIDGTVAFKGAMASLANLIPAPHTKDVFVPRPAATILNDFSSFTNVAQGEALLCVGTRFYGMVATNRFPGHSEPFCFDTSTNAFVTIQGVTSGNTPTSISTAGDWTPPTMAQVGGRIIVTHPGFSGSNFFGWLDLTGFADTSHTGNTHGTVTVDTLSANVILAGWRPGMTITDTAGDIPAGTRIVSIASGGLSLTLSAAATGSHSGTTFTVAGGTTVAPLWAAGNVNQNPLVAKPTCVAQFSGRAYYGVANAVAYSDSGDPLQASDASGVQVLTFQNGLNVTALAGLPLNNQLGGVIQSLMCFQGGANIQQITGDQSTSNLSVNTLNEAVGTFSPLSVAPTPLGLMFIAPDGLRLIDFFGHVSEPIGANGEGVSLPFINALNPTRICAAYNEDVYRVTVTGNVAVGGQILSSTQSVEYWYHLKGKIWSGPHNFPYRIIVASQSSLTFTGFSLVSGALGLWQSASLPTFNSSYLENGVQLAWTYQSVLLPDNSEMAANAMIETTIAIALTQNVTAKFTDESGNTIDTATLTPLGVQPLWGTAIWGSFTWGGTGGIYAQQQIFWDIPIVFKQGQISFTGTSSYSVRIGPLYMRYQILGYLLQGVA